MRELTVISGKGGTGKTSVVAALAALADSAVLVDCDVETPDLHLLLDPHPVRTEEFVGGEVAYLRWDLCTGCGRCAQLCQFDAIVACGPPNRFAERTYMIDGRACEGCRLCAALCPADAITMGPSIDGVWHVSETRCGPLVHARLEPGHGNSGKLVTRLRQEARTVARRAGAAFILCDGVPGIGCPAIAALAGADLALAVAEPSRAGRHDLERVIALARHFSVPLVVCVNRFDEHLRLTEEIEAMARAAGAAPIGRIPRDPAVVAAQVACASVVEASDGPAAAALRALWQLLRDRLAGPIPQATTPSPAQE